MGTSNENLTDGLDGLAIVPTVISGSVFLVQHAAGTTLSGFNLAEYLKFLRLKVTELAVLRGLVWRRAWIFANASADVFMGDVGALSLGGGLGALAVVTKNEFVSAIIHGLFLAEAVSVILQVGSYKLKKTYLRITLASSLKNLAPEPKVIVRFWIISILLALTGIATLKFR